MDGFTNAQKRTSRRKTEDRNSCCVVAIGFIFFLLSPLLSTRLRESIKDYFSAEEEKKMLNVRVTRAIDSDYHDACISFDSTSCCRIGTDCRNRGDTRFIGLPPPPPLPPSFFSSSFDATTRQRVNTDRGRGDRKEILGFTLRIWKKIRIDGRDWEEN